MPRTLESTTGEAARVGEDLRDARLALGISLEEMADSLRIRRAYLVALEEGRVQNLPGPAYAVGFVRSYARALGLDSDEMVRRFRDLSGPAVTRKTDLVFPEPVPERGVPAGAVVLLGAVFAIGGYAAWYNWSGAGSRSLDTVPPLPPRLELAAEQGERVLMPRAPAASASTSTSASIGSGTSQRPGPGALPASSPAPAADQPSQTAASLAPSAPGQAVPPPFGLAPLSPVAPAAPFAAPSPGANTSAQAATVPPAPAPPPLVAEAPAAPAAAPAALVAQPVAAPVAPLPADGTRIVLRASQESWIHVRDPRSGQVLLNRVLRPGESWNVPQREGLVLTTGKAEGLDLVVDGQVSQILSGVIGVRRDIALDADRLRIAQPLPPLRTAHPAPPASLPQ
jgi:cytoskeleton protein RodZ